MSDLCGNSIMYEYIYAYIILVSTEIRAIALARRIGTYSKKTPNQAYTIGVLGGYDLYRLDRATPHSGQINDGHGEPLQTACTHKYVSFSTDSRSECRCTWSPFLYVLGPQNSHYYGPLVSCLTRRLRTRPNIMDLAR